MAFPAVEPVPLSAALKVLPPVGAGGGGVGVGVGAGGVGVGEGAGAGGGGVGAGAGGGGVGAGATLVQSLVSRVIRITTLPASARAMTDTPTDSSGFKTG